MPTTTNALNITLAGIVVYDGLGSFTADTVTQHDLLIGGASNTITSVAPSATSGVPVISQGAAADPTFGTAVVAGGGTGNTTFTAYSIIAAGTTSTGAFQNVSGVGNAGQALISNGAGLLPTWQAVSAAGAVSSITGDSGGAEVPSSGNFYILGSGSITVAGSANTETITLTGLTNHAILVGAGTTTITKVGPSATSGQVLQSSGAAADPAFSTATYPAVATGAGTILRADGTNWLATTATYPNTTTISQLLYSSSGNVVGGLATANDGLLVTSNTGVPSILAGPGTSGNILQSNAAAAPSFSTPTYPSASGTTGVILRSDGTNNVYTTATYPNTTSVSQLLYSSSANVIGGLTTANDGLLVTSNTGVPSILAGPGTTGQVLQSNAAAAPSFSTATFPSTAGSAGTILRSDGTNWVASTSTYPNTNAVSTLLYASSANVMGALATANDGLLVTSNSGVPSILAGPGTSGNILQSNAAAAPSFSTPTYPSASGSTGVILRSDGTNNVYTTATYPATTTINQVLYSSAANVIGGITTANNGVHITGTTGIPSVLANGTTGQVLTATTSNPPSWANSSAVGGSLVLISTQTASASGSLLWTSGITTTYNTYLLVINDMLTSGAATLELQISSDGGSTYKTSGYLSGNNRTVYNSATWANNNSTAGYIFDVVGASSQINAAAWIFNVTANTVYTSCSGTGSSQVGGNDVMFIFSGSYNTGTILVNALKLLPSAGTLTSGTASLYGVLPT